MTSTRPAMTTEQQLREMNDALLVSSVRLHEAAEQARKAEEKAHESEERHRTLAESLRETQQRLEFTLASANAGDWDLDVVTGKAQCSFRHDQCFGASEPIPDWSYEMFLSYVHPDDRANEDRKFRAAVASGQDWNINCRVIWPDGSLHWIESSGLTYRYKDGRPTRMLGMVRDVTERKRSEEHQAMLTRELQHRTKNLLAVIVSIAGRSLPDGRPIHEARESFVARLRALAHANDALSEAEWIGAPLKDVIDRAVVAFSRRVSIEGKYIRLSAAATQGFALVVHELCTNASKYGAFSTPNGSVAICWSIEHVGAEPRFAFRWQERGGPRVVPPKHTSFGTTLMELAIRGADTRPHFDYAPEGLTYTFEAPLAEITD